MVPTKKRNHPSVFLKYENYGLLFDCGEGTQRQFRLAGISPTKITHIFISHMHGDHVFGLPGLLETLSMNQYMGTLQIYGPEKLKDYIKYIDNLFNIHIKYKLNIIKPGIITNENLFKISAIKLRHTVECYGFCFLEKDKRKIKHKFIGKLPGPLLGKLQSGKLVTFNKKKIKPSDATFIEKGIKVCYISDTNTFPKISTFCKNADLLILDSTFTSDLQDKARQFEHMTASDAAIIASRAKAKKLILTHISQRYKTSRPLLRDAKKHFDNVTVAKDLMSIKL